MSLLPVTNYIQLVSANDPTQGWGLDGSTLGLVAIADASTFNYSSPCMMGQGEQSLVFRHVVDPNQQLRHNANLDIQMTDKSVDSLTFMTDSCFLVIAAEECGVTDAVRFTSLNVEGGTIAVQPDGVIKVETWDATNPDMVFRSCFLIVPVDDIGQFTENSTGVDETTAVPVLTGVQIGDTEVPAADETTGDLGATADETTAAVLSAPSGASLIPSDAFGPGGSSPMLASTRQTILDTEGGSLLGGDSGEFDFLSNDEEAAAVEVKEVVAKPVVAAPPPQESGVSTGSIVLTVAVTAVVVFAMVAAFKHYRVGDKIKEFIDKMQKRPALEKADKKDVGLRNVRE